LFREMRRKDKSGSQELAVKLLTDTNEGYLSTISVDNGYPAIICINHYYDGQYIYFHSAKSGHKIDNIIANEKVCFMVTDGIEVKPKAYATKYRSVVIYGSASFVEDKEKKKEILYKLSNKFVGKFISTFTSQLTGSLDVTAVIKIKIEHITFKEAK